MLPDADPQQTFDTVTVCIMLHTVPEGSVTFRQTLNVPPPQGNIYGKLCTKDVALGSVFDAVRVMLGVLGSQS